MLKYKRIKNSEVYMRNGIVIVNKESGLTSQAVVNRVKRIFGVDKAGHTGTLDPMATGVLPVLIGRGVKVSEFMLTSDKHYIATLTLGLTTDTEDITGNILSRCEREVSEDEARAAVASFVGEYMQTPPMYSALKVGGRKLCDLARRGVEIEREARAVRIYSIDVSRIDEVNYTLDVKCSKGTYIRTLCADIGARLGVGGIMSSLCRATASGFGLSDGMKLSELEALTEEEKDARVIPVSRIFEDLPVVKLPDFFAKLAHSGLEIYLSKIGCTANVGDRVTLHDSVGCFALGEIREYDTGLAIKPIRQL